MLKKTVLSLLALSLTAATAFAGTDRLWLHVKVDGDGGDSSHVRVNVPLALAKSMLPALTEGHFDADHFRFNHSDLDTNDLRKMWAELKKVGDNEFITVKDHGDEVHISRSGENVLVHADDKDSKVMVKVPVTVVDALLSGKGDELDLEAAIDALEKHGAGELVSVDDEDSTVRIWVDSKSQSE